MVLFISYGHLHANLVINTHRTSSWTWFVHGVNKKTAATEQVQLWTCSMNNGLISGKISCLSVHMYNTYPDSKRDNNGQNYAYYTHTHTHMHIILQNIMPCNCLQQTRTWYCCYYITSNVCENNDIWDSTYTCVGSCRWTYLRRQAHEHSSAASRYCASSHSPTYPCCLVRNPAHSSTCSHSALSISSASIKVSNITTIIPI